MNIVAQGIYKIEIFVVVSANKDPQTSLPPKYQNKCNCPPTLACMCHIIDAAVVHKMLPTAHTQICPLLLAAQGVRSQADVSVQLFQP